LIIFGKNNREGIVKSKVMNVFIKIIANIIFTHIMHLKLNP